MNDDVSGPMLPAPGIRNHQDRAFDDDAVARELWTVKTGAGAFGGFSASDADAAIDRAVANFLAPSTETTHEDNALPSPAFFPDADPIAVFDPPSPSLLERRRSVRHFTDVAVQKARVLDVIQHAAWAPSGGNDQRWKVSAIAPDRAHAFLVANESRAWAALTPKLHAVTARRLGPHAPVGESEAMVRAMIESDGRSQGRPWMLVVHYEPEFLPKSLWRRYLRAVTHPLFGGSRLEALVDVWRVHARVDPSVNEHSVAMFLYALTLAATERDLGSCIQYSPRAFPRKLRHLARIPKANVVVGTMLLGEANLESEAVKNGPARAKRQAVAVDVVT